MQIIAIHSGTDTIEVLGCCSPQAFDKDRHAQADKSLNKPDRQRTLLVLPTVSLSLTGALRM